MEKLFKLKEHNTTVKTEIMAGITTFLTMAYILLIVSYFGQIAHRKAGNSAQLNRGKDERFFVSL